MGAAYRNGSNELKYIVKNICSSSFSIPQQRLLSMPLFRTRHHTRLDRQLGAHRMDRIFP